MTERQRLIARKLAMQAARNRLRRMEGLEVLELLEEEPRLRQCMAYFNSFINGRPVSRLDYRAPEAQVWAWLLENLGLAEGGGYFYCLGAVWARVRILDVCAAVQALWANRDFLLIEADFSRILGAGFDSRDEEHFLIDILPLPPAGLAPGLPEK